VYWNIIILLKLLEEYREGMRVSKIVFQAEKNQCKFRVNYLCWLDYEQHWLEESVEAGRKRFCNINGVVMYNERVL